VSFKDSATEHIVMWAAFWRNMVPDGGQVAVEAPVEVENSDVMLADEELTEEVDPDGWDELGEVFAFRYLPGDGRKEGALQVPIFQERLSRSACAGM